MPGKKLRGSEGKNKHTPSVFEAMGLHSEPKIGTPHDPDDYTFRNIQRNNTKGAGKSPKSWNEGYDVATKVTIPSAKGAGSNKRTMRGV
jgi:hypothetical protein